MYLNNYNKKEKERKKTIKSLWNDSKLKNLDNKSIKFKTARDCSSLYLFYKYAWSRLNIKVNNSLDIGCGTGIQMSLILDNKLVNFVKGIDFSPGAIEKCKKFMKYCDHNNFDLMTIDFELFETKKKYDLISAIQVINYLESLDLFFSKIDTLLLNGGYLIISDGQNKKNFSFIHMVKSNNLVRKIFGYHKLSKKYPDPLVFPKKVIDIRKMALKYNYKLIDIIYKNTYLTSYLEKICFFLSKKSIRNQPLRIFLGIIYKLLSLIIFFENFILKNFSLGGQYFCYLKKKEIN
tara:strand:- start:1 stop:876 length:876 start_codon:yes stop_codon:yes gene_type:complete